VTRKPGLFVAVDGDKSMMQFSPGEPKADSSDERTEGCQMVSA
jgi:hypothetical protein